ncbi:MAG: hypothetical protein QMD46_09880 [Methanomicrobiales archaeon]|nr:hypothetical protein [Methanomicrobiales archaeon]MDI6876789.1 hypothetical protein [Methanomicrobiales archaeon]
MADFVETTNTKTAVRTLTAPIADVAAFDAIVQAVLSENPFGCVEYIQAGVTHPGVEKVREAYTVRVNYEDGEGNRVGYVTARSPSVAAFTANAAEILANAALAAAMGGTAVRDTEAESFTCQLRCHDPNGEIYSVAFTRDAVRITSYQDDAIRLKVETWADTVPALA